MIFLDGREDGCFPDLAFEMLQRRASQSIAATLCPIVGARLDDTNNHINECKISSDSGI